MNLPWSCLAKPCEERLRTVSQCHQGCVVVPCSSEPWGRAWPAT